MVTIDSLERYLQTQRICKSGELGYLAGLLERMIAKFGRVVRVSKLQLGPTLQQLILRPKRFVNIAARLGSGERLTIRVASRRELSVEIRRRRSILSRYKGTKASTENRIHDRAHYDGRDPSSGFWSYAKKSPNVRLGTHSDTGPSRLCIKNTDSCNLPCKDERVRKRASYC